LVFSCASSSASPAYLLQRLDRSAGERADCHIPAVAEGWCELLHHEKNLAVIGASVVLRFDVDWPGLACVCAAVQVGPSDHMRMVKAEARRSRHERYPPHERRAFLGSAVDIARDHLPVPVHQLRRVSVVADIDNNLLLFLEP